MTIKNQPTTEGERYLSRLVKDGKIVIGSDPIAMAYPGRVYKPFFRRDGMVDPRKLLVERRGQMHKE
jgi:hypothetical protein